MESATDRVADRAAHLDGGAIYAQARARFVDLIESLTDAELATNIPATPAWRVRDALAHVVGITADLNAGNIRMVDPEAWTAEQVTLRRNRSIADVIAEWDREGPTFEDGLRRFGYSMGAHFVGDLFTHYQDVRAALGLPADRDDLLVRVSLDFYLESWDEALAEAEPGSIEVIAGAERQTVGRGAAFATVAADPFEILRACSGRRSADQIRAFTFTGDRERTIATISRYSLPEQAVVD